MSAVISGSKVFEVNKILESKGISRAWHVRTDREAISFVFDVLETESVLGDEKWDEAVREFTKYVRSYTDFMDELAMLHYSEYGSNCE